jgi:2-polyprenyl-3-methyl-5-hydroxy-6-metoxy-1,4-benzoquinol methylase
MRRDWDERARHDAERVVYTRDSQADEADFSASGRANYDQLVRPYLPVLLNGASARECRVLEIGCGVGRMTRWFAESFGEVHGIDVAPETI